MFKMALLVKVTTTSSTRNLDLCGKSSVKNVYFGITDSFVSLPHQEKVLFVFLHGLLSNNFFLVFLVLSIPKSLFLEKLK